MVKAFLLTPLVSLLILSAANRESAEWALSRRVNRTKASLRVKAGASFFIYNPRNLKKSLIRPKSDFGFDLYFRTLPAVFLFQGVSTLFSPVFKKGSLPGKTAGGEHISTDTEGYQLSVDYNLIFRFYRIAKIKSSGSIWKYLYVGGGVGAVMFLWRHITVDTPAEPAFFSVNPAISLFVGFQYSYKTSPFSAGIELRASDILSQPADIVNDRKSYRFIDRPANHQFHLGLAIVFAYHFGFDSPSAQENF